MILMVQNLTVTVRGAGDVVHRVSLQCSSREVVGITGPSGAGKSTLARALCGLQHPDVGHVWTTPTAGSVQLAFQNAIDTFPLHLPVAIPLMDAYRYGTPAGARYDRRAARGVLESMLENLGMSKELLPRRPTEVSGGQLQRLALVRALAPNPAFLVLDEITSALDEDTERQVLSVVGRHRRFHEMGVLVVSHDLGLLERNCDRILVMDHGEIVESGNPTTLFTSPVHETTRALVRARNTILGGIV